MLLRRFECRRIVPFLWFDHEAAKPRNSINIFLSLDNEQDHHPNTSGSVEIVSLKLYNRVLFISAGPMFKFTRPLFLRSCDSKEEVDGVMDKLKPAERRECRWEISF